jgi:hypothetical protein
MLRNENIFNPQFFNKIERNPAVCHTAFTETARLFSVFKCWDEGEWEG